MKTTDLSSDIFKVKSKISILFEALSADSLQYILAHSTVQTFKKNSILTQQGDFTEHIYFIINGIIRSFRSNADGDETTLTLLESGDVSMEAIIFKDEPSPVTIQTLSECQILFIPSTLIQSFSYDNKQLASNILKAVSQHCKGTLYQVDAVTTKTPIQRLGYYFLQKHIEQGSEKMDFDLPFKKSSVANHLGMTPETFSRALQNIKKLGIKIDANKICLKDAYTLCGFCDADTAHKCSVANKADCPICPMHKEQA